MAFPFFAGSFAIWKCSARRILLQASHHTEHVRSCWAIRIPRLSSRPLRQACLGVQRIPAERHLNEPTVLYSGFFALGAKMTKSHKFTAKTKSVPAVVFIADRGVTLQRWFLS